MKWKLKEDGLKQPTFLSSLSIGVEKVEEVLSSLVLDSTTLTSSTTSSLEVAHAMG